MESVLQSIQRGHGMVGIISHVSLLEETIPTKIEIVKTARGSRIKIASDRRVCSRRDEML